MEGTSASSINENESPSLQSSVRNVEEGNYRNEEDEEGSLETNESAILLPRPPTTPNVPIRDPTICPVCKQPGIYIHVLVCVC